MSRAEELAENLADLTSKYNAPSHERGVLNGATEELRRLSAVEAELEALKATLAASCADEREQLWEATPGGGCSRALNAERELAALKKAISEAEPVAEIAVTDSNVGGVWATVWRTSLPAGEYKLYTLKGIK